MNRKIAGLTSVLVLLGLLCVPSIASADAITWTLSGTFDDGGTLSGSFGYDALTNTYSAIDITTSATGVFAGGTYTTLSGVFGSSSTGTLLGAATGDLTNTDLLFLMFGSALTNSGGTVTLIGVGEGTCNDATCDNPAELRVVTGGSGSAPTAPTAATPEPSAFSLLGIVLGGLLVGTATRKLLLV